MKVGEIKVIEKGRQSWLLTRYQAGHQGWWFLPWRYGYANSPPSQRWWI
jgi:hypothetical protein